MTDRSGGRAWLETGSSHAAASIHSVAGPVRSREEVTTVALDDLKLREPALIKLDVEGAEIEAIQGAQRLLESGAVLVYEDHGMDRACRPTRAALDMGLVVHSVSLAGRIERVTDLDMVQRVKRRPARGYNFIASLPHSPFTSRLEA